MNVRNLFFTWLFIILKMIYIKLWSGTPGNSRIQQCLMSSWMSIHFISARFTVSWCKHSLIYYSRQGNQTKGNNFITKLGRVMNLTQCTFSQCGLVWCNSSTNSFIKQWVMANTEVLTCRCCPVTIDATLIYFNLCWFILGQKGNFGKNVLINIH